MSARPVIDVGMKITRADRALFAARRFYNRTFGAYVFGWGNDRLTVFGYNIMSKYAVDAMYSLQARENLKSGLTVDEYREVCQTLAMVSVLPIPDLPDGTFSDRLMAEHGISLVWNRVYIFST